MYVPGWGFFAFSVGLKHDVWCGRIMVLGSLLPDFSDIPTLAVQSFSERVRRAPGQVLPYFQALGF